MSEMEKIREYAFKFYKSGETYVPNVLEGGTPIVRCKDCKHLRIRVHDAFGANPVSELLCGKQGLPEVPPDWFCPLGEWRREDGDGERDE